MSTTRTSSGLLAVALFLCGCAGTTSFSSVRWTGRATITVDDQVDVIFDRDSRRGVQTAVYHDGRIEGVSGLDDPRLEGYFASGHHVDHPRLAEWRQLQAELIRMAEDSATETGAFLDAASRLPFPTLVSDCTLGFVEGDPERAASILDFSVALDLHDETAAELVASALASPRATDAKLAEWVQSELVAESSAALLQILRSDRCGPRTLSLILEDIDEVSWSQRAEAYETVGTRLVTDPTYAYRLVEQVDELGGEDRAEVTRRLLKTRGATPEYALEVIENLDDFFAGSRRMLLIAAARVCIEHPRAPGAVVAALDDLYSDDRRRAALELLSWPESATLAGPIVAEIDSFYGSERAEVLRAVAASPGFRGSVQRACVRAAEKELFASEREVVLRELAESPHLEPETAAIIRFLLEKN